MSSMWQAVCRQPAGFWAVIALACLGEALWLIVVNVGLDMDSVQYLRYANVLVGHHMPFYNNVELGHNMDVDAVARRAAGYPLLLLLGGVPFTGSLVGIVIIQAAMAIAMPLLAYKTIEPYGGRRAALITALVLIVSIEPFNYSKTILTEQSFKFFLLLLICLASRAYRAPSSPLFALIAVVTIFLGLIRPQGSVIAILIFGTLMIAHADRWNSLLKSFAAVIIAVGTYSFAISMYLAAYVPTEFPVSMQKTSNTLVSRFENLLLYNIYFSNTHGTPALAGDRGTERAELRSVLEAYAKQSTQQWAAIAPRHYFGAFADNPSAWVDEIYRNPNPYYLNMIKVAVDALEASDSDKAKRGTSGLVRRVIWETYSAEPRYILGFLARFFLGSPYSTTGAQLSWDQFYIARRSPFGANNGPASKEIIDLATIYLSDFPGYPPPEMRQYPGGVEKLLQDVFVQKPAELNFWVLWDVIDRLKGRLESGPVFFASLWEFRDIYYLKYLVYLGKVAEFFFGTPSVYQTGSQVYDSAAFFLPGYSSMDLPVKMQSEIGSGLQPAAFRGLIVGGPHYDLFVKSYTVLWLTLRDIINVATIATLLFCFRAGAGWPAALIGLVVLYHASVVALVSDPHIRFIEEVLPLSILLAGLCLSSFARLAFPKTSRSARLLDGSLSSPNYGLV